MFNTSKSAAAFAALEKIAATPSKNEKEALVEAALANGIFMKTVVYAYDRFKRYGIAIAPKKREGLAPGTNTLDEPQFWSILDKLISRELSGSAALETVQNAVDLLDAPSSELFRRIIAKDLRAGFTDGTVNRVLPGTLVEYPYMRCSLQPKSNMAKPGFFDKGAVSQEKADGMFANIDRSGDTVAITSRQGSPFPAGCMPELEAELIRLLNAETQTHGELVVYEHMEDVGPDHLSLMPREKGNGVLNSLLAGGALEPGQHVAFMAWDQIPLSAVKPKGKYAEPYKARLVGLISQLKTQYHSPWVKLIPTRMVKNMAEALVHYRELLTAGKEGTVLKHPDAIWKDGTSKDQIKFKLEVDVDLVVRGIVPGRPGTKNEGRPGSLRCESACGQLVVDVTVKNEKMRDQLEKEPDAFMEKIMAVRANSVLSPSESSEVYSLFLPRFVEDQVRSDKSLADDLAQVKAQFEAAAA